MSMLSKKRKNLWKWIALIIMLLPLWMWLAWRFTPKRNLVIAIVDKTSMTPHGQEHLSLSWILNHERFTLTRGRLYSVSRDYFGFFPQQNEKYRIKGLERFSSDQLEQLSRDCDLAYYTDTYGVYYNEWHADKNAEGRSQLIYGGMSAQDIEFLRLMKTKKKLVIAEFNDVASPTPAIVRGQFEALFGIHWTGWTGRYFDSFDTSVNKELPQWLVHNYMAQHDGHWPFHKNGVAFVSLNDEVIVLEDSTHLLDPMPHILSFVYGQNQLHLPGKIKYNDWFDVMTITDTSNHAISAYDISVNANGMKELNKYNLPNRFPAVIMHGGNSYPFYYFCGNFTDNPIGMFTSYFKGISFFKWTLYNKDNPNERKSFFWEFYKPLVTTILNNYYKKLHPNG